MSTLSRIGLSMSVVVMLGLASMGCQSGPKPGAIPVDFDIDASRTSILAGENVTFTAQTENTYGRDAEIKWHTTGGEMETIDGDRIRQVTFDEPGEYKVSADLTIDGKRVDSDMVKIYVRPLQ